jgi:GDPmannose 4,6-dehydratase
MSFEDLGISLQFEGKEDKEVGKIASINQERLQELELEKCKLKIGDIVVAVDPRYYRPTEVDLLIGDPTKAQTKLGWKPQYDLPALVKDMMKSDLKLMKRQQFLKQSGYKILNEHE